LSDHWWRQNCQAPDDVIGQSDIPAFGSRGPKSALSKRLKYNHTFTTSVHLIRPRSYLQWHVFHLIRVLQTFEGPRQNYQTVQIGKPQALIQSKKSDHNYQKLSSLSEKVMFLRPPTSLYIIFGISDKVTLSKKMNSFSIMDKVPLTVKLLRRTELYFKYRCTWEYVTCVYTTWK